MFFGKKAWQLLERIGHKSDSTSAELEQLNQRTNTAMTELQDLKKTVDKHDMAVVDMLDSWEEWQDKLQQTLEDFRDSPLNELTERLQCAQDQEKALLDLLVSFYDQLFALSKAANSAGDEAWIRQFRMTDSKLSDLMNKTGIEVMGGTNKPFDYDTMEAIHVLDTDRLEKDMTIAEQYQCGYRYHGKIIRKGVVAVYRYGKGERI